MDKITYYKEYLESRKRIKKFNFKKLLSLTIAHPELVKFTSMLLSKEWDLSAVKEVYKLSKNTPFIKEYIDEYTKVKKPRADYKLEEAVHNSYLEHRKNCVEALTLPVNKVKVSYKNKILYDLDFEDRDFCIVLFLDLFINSYCLFDINLDNTVILEDVYAYKTRWGLNEKEIVSLSQFEEGEGRGLYAIFPKEKTAVILQTTYDSTSDELIDHFFKVKLEKRNIVVKEIQGEEAADLRGCALSNVKEVQYGFLELGTV